MRISHRFKVYAPDGAELGSLPNLTEWKYSSPFCEIPNLDASIKDEAPNANLLYVPCEIAVEASIDGSTWKEPPNSRFLRIKRNLNAVGQDRIRKYTMPGYGWLLNKMRQLTTTGLTADGKRMFNSSNAGMIMKTLIDENKAAGIVTGIGYNFTTTLDSNGVAWNKVISIGYDPGLDLFTILNNLADQGIVDWNFQGRTLQLFNIDTVLGTTRDIILQRGVDISGMPVEGTLEEMAHTAIVLGEAGKKITRSNATAPTYWGKWVAFVSQGGVSDTGTMELFADAALSTNGSEAIQLTAEMPYVKSNFDPFYDFYPGEFLKIPDDQDVIQTYRVRGINFARNNSGERRVDLIINDRIQEKAIRNARRTNGIVGGASIKGNGSVPTPDVGRRKPKQATGLSGSSQAYLDTRGRARSAVSLTYPGVTTDVNNIALDIDRYNFQAQKVGTTAWRDWGSSTDLTHTYSPISPGEQWNVKYRAISTTGVAGDFSTTVLITGASDAVAPSKPSDPILTSKLGTIKITWNGLTDAGTAIEDDFAYMEVYQTGVTDPIASLVSPKEPAILTEVTIGTSYTFYFKAVDYSGNKSVDSDTATIAVASIMDDPTAALDIVNDVTISGGVTKITYSASDPSGSGSQIGHTWFKLTSNVVVGQWRWDGSAWVSHTLDNLVIATLDAAKITTGTLAAARIAASSITADKIDAGAVTGVKISADAIDGKVITGATVRTAASGARVQMDSTGLKAFNSSNTQLVHISSATGILHAVGANISGTIDGSTIEGSLFRTATSGARLQIDTNGRIRTWLTDGTLFLDFNPTLTSQNALIEGGLEVEALNLQTASSGNTGGILIADINTLSITSTGGRDIMIDSDDHTLIPSAWFDGYTSGSSAGLDVLSNGRVARFVSGRKWKVAIEDYEFDKRILKARPRTWYDRRSAEEWAEAIDKGLTGYKVDQIPELRPGYGFIAEEIEELGLTEFVRYDDGKADGLDYRTMWIPLVPIVAEHEDRLGALESQLAEILSSSVEDRQEGSDA